MKRNWLIHDDIWRYWLVFGGDVSVWGGTGWYLVVLGQYNLVLLGIKLKKKVEIWSDVTIAGRTTNKRTRKDKATQPNGPRMAERSNRME